MATVQVDGSSAVTANSTVNNGGTAVNVGASSVLETRTLGTVDLGIFGSTVVSGVNTKKAVDGGVFAYNSDGVIVKVTESLANVANDFLVSAANTPENIQSIHQVSGIYIDTTTSAIRNGDWNGYSGVFNPDTSGILADFDVDAAANPTRTVPGELYFLQGSPVPQTAEYSSKNT